VPWDATSSTDSPTPATPWWSPAEMRGGPLRWRPHTRGRQPAAVDLAEPGAFADVLQPITDLLGLGEAFGAASRTGAGCGRAPTFPDPGDGQPVTNFSGGPQRYAARRVRPPTRVPLRPRR
jgi:hypothetical protein